MSHQPPFHTFNDGQTPRLDMYTFYERYGTDYSYHDYLLGAYDTDYYDELDREMAAEEEQ